MRLVDIDARECWACAHHCKNGGCSVWCENGEAFELRADLKEAAIVEAVPVVHGEWVENDNGSRVCSVCDSEAYWDTDYGQQLFGWCPYCGAKMT